jgi:glycosyltransferase involved in cell wall biosynthesis
VKDTNYWIDSLKPWTWFQTWQRMRRYGPEAIVLQWWTPWWAPAWFLFGLLNRLSLRKPLIFLCHNVLPHEARWWDPPVARAVLRRGSGFIVQSEEEKERLLALVPSARTTIQPLPILDLLADEDLSREEARARLDLPGDIPVLLFFGIVREYKGLRDLLLALPQIRAHLGGIRLLVAGEFWEDPASYLETIERLGVADAVQIENGYIPNEKARLYFSAADLLIAPYRSVTGSAVVQMAYGFGLPVVTTRIGGLAEIVDEGLGLLVPPKDADALAGAIVRYFDEDLGSSLRENIRNQRARFSWTGVVTAIEALAREVEP